ncbi:protein HIRA isoform X2 [Lepeophtheirus salmonis]|uniref:protein HIRA isoform X2 n=1 Tax=Lepeophtheirus salmonis TaxID=72036 RepID=UPI001AE81149|nr:protein HIRA-like isoform X2 [Lepeophtheirus salmonis]
MKLLKPSWIAKEGQPIFSIDIHPDGTRFVTGGQGNDSSGRISIWNMKYIKEHGRVESSTSPKLLSQMDHHLGCVNTVRWSHSGRFLASGGDDKIVMIWEQSNLQQSSNLLGGANVEYWKCKFTLRRHDGDILDLAWSVRDNFIATASVDNSIIIWNADKLPEVIKILKGHTGLVKGVIFDPVGKYLASQSDDKTLRLWRTSDWEVDSVITEPFLECGATTHFLRPGWSPDGSLLVSAHAMNGGGPTAQMIDRQGWKKSRDFVGHKKAVSCVRFHNQIFQREGQSDSYVTVALGSRDRGFSVWCTNLKRPYFVVNDIFDQSVLDISWWKNILVACSMDGSIAACVLDEKELGVAISDSKTYEFMTNRYGKSFGTKPKSQQNGTSLIAENPEALGFNDDENSSCKDSIKVNGVSSIPQFVKPKGPTDKQIEARTLDGKRRITPVFIPEFGEPLGTGEFGSASSRERSKIPVEKQNKIQPVIKPSLTPPQEPPVNIIAVKKKPKNSSSDVKSIPVKKKPSSVAPTPPQSVTSKTSEPLDSSSITSSTGTSSSSSDSKDVPPSQTSKTLTKEDKLKDAKLRKPELVSKRKLPENGDDDDEDAPLHRPKRRRLRPFDDDDDDEEEVGIDRCTSSYPTLKHHRNSYRLPPLNAQSRCHVYTFPDDNQACVTNDYSLSKIHHLRYKSQHCEWETLFTSPIMSVLRSQNFVIAATCDGCIHVFSPYDVGSSAHRLLPPLVLPSPISKIAGGKNEKLALITVDAGFYLWDLSQESPRIIMKNESLIPIVSPDASVSKLSFLPPREEPIIITSDGKSFCYNTSLGAWLKLTDGNDGIKEISGYRGTSTLNGNCSLPLADLDRQTEVRCNGKSNFLLSNGKQRNEEEEEKMKYLASITHCESQRCTAQYLSSCEEYKYWLLAEIRHLSSNRQNKDRELRQILRNLLGPAHSSSDAFSNSSSWNPKVMSINKRDLLKEALKILGGSSNYQKLFAEFNDQLNSSHDLADASSILNI